MTEPTPNLPSSLFDRPLPEGYRDEIRALEAASQAAAPNRAGSNLLFQLGEVRLALPTRVASAVAPVLHIARIPHRSGTVLLGLAAFRGEILPCCSLSRILDLPVSSESSESSERSEPSAARTLILQDAFGRRWAVPIDGVLGIRTGDSEPTEPAPPIDPQWLQGSLRDASGTAHLLDPATLFRQITLATA